VRESFQVMKEDLQMVRGEIGEAENGLNRGEY